MKETEATPTRSERRDAAENRQKILEAAHRLFEQHGVEQVSMNLIANEAQIGPGTLYRRYRNKGELCLDMIKDNLDLFFEDMETYLQQNETLPPGQRLRGILTYFIRFREQKAQLLTGVEDSLQATRGKSLTNSPIYQDLHQLFLKLFDEMEQGEPSLPTNVFRADLLLIALTRDSYSFQREVRGYSPEEIVEQLSAMFLQ